MLLLLFLYPFNKNKKEWKTVCILQNWKNIKFSYCCEFVRLSHAFQIVLSDTENSGRNIFIKVLVSRLNFEFFCVFKPNKKINFFFLKQNVRKKYVFIFLFFLRGPKRKKILFFFNKYFWTICGHLHGNSTKPVTRTKQEQQLNKIITRFTTKKLKTA